MREADPIGLLRPAIVVLMIVGVILAASACGDDGNDTGANDDPVAALESGTWMLSTIQTTGEPRVVPAGVRVDAVFSDGTVSGAGPVNTYSGPYTADGDGALKIGALASTSKAGPASFMAVEQLYFDALAKISTFSVADDQLTLADSGGAPLLVYTADNAPPLVGGEWKVTGYNNGAQAVVSPVAGSRITVNFAKTGVVDGFGGVNTYSGAFELDGAAITFGKLATTRGAGSPNLMKQEELYLAALQSAATWSVRGNTFELRTADDAIAVTGAATQQ